MQCKSFNGFLLLGDDETLTGETLCRPGNLQRDGDGVRGQSANRTRSSSLTFCIIQGRFLCAGAEGTLNAAVNGADDLETAGGGAGVESDGDRTGASSTGEDVWAGDDDDDNTDETIVSGNLGVDVAATKPGGGGRIVQMPYSDTLYSVAKDRGSPDYYGVHRLLASEEVTAPQREP